MQGGSKIVLSIAATGHGRLGVGALFVNARVFLLGEEFELLQLEGGGILLLDESIGQAGDVFALIGLEEGGDDVAGVEGVVPA